MIIAIPTNGTDLHEPLSDQFGRAKFFCVYNLENKAVEFLENPALNAPGGAGIQSADLLLNRNVNVLITYRIGEKALSVMKKAQIEIFAPVGKDIAENIRSFISGRLPKLPV